MTSDRIPVLVLGLGNLLCEDDGVGVAAVHRLMRDYAMDEGELVEDGGTLGLALLPLIERADRAILVDAIAGDGPPGSPVRLEGDEVAPAVYERLSPHQIGVADLLAGASLLGRAPAQLVVVGVVPASIGLGLGCTPAVAAAIPDLVQRVVAELTALGHPPPPRPRPQERDDRASHALGLAG